jgi:hypothetical protein
VEKLSGNKPMPWRIKAVMITVYSHRRPRAHLFAFSGGRAALVCVLVIGAMTALGLMTQRAHSAPPAAPPGYAWVH